MIVRVREIQYYDSISTYVRSCYRSSGYVQFFSKLASTRQGGSLTRLWRLFVSSFNFSKRGQLRGKFQIG